MRQRFLVLIGVFLLFLVSVSGDFNIGGAYSYLGLKSINGSYNSNIVDTSLALLAMGSVGRDISKEIAYLKSEESDQKCWPKQGCTVKDSAFAAVAMKAAGMNTEEEEKWFNDAQSAATLSGTWYLEIATNDIGKCKVSYDQNGQSIEKEVSVVNGVFPDCGNITFFDINKCLAKNVISTKPSMEIDVNCESLSSVESLTILYKTSNSFYLVDEDQSSRAKLTVLNGCFGRTSKTSCDYESSLYANWALKELQSQLNTLFYLKQGYDATNPLHSSILYIVSGDASYSKELANRQKNDGSWNSNVYQTAFAVLALKNSEYADNVESAKKFFDNEQLADYSMGNVQDTAITLYAAYADASSLPECFGNDIRLCEKQAGLCEGAYEPCKNNTYLGCDDNTYEAFNSSYEIDETSCDDVDNDCDGNIDTGCDCAAGFERACGLQYGVCNGTIESCGSDGKWPGCDYSKITGYEESEKSCKDDKDNDCDNYIDFIDDDCLVSSICNGDDVCDENRGEDENNCPEDCEDVDTCRNGIKDDFEDDVDCGGVCAKPCEDEGNKDDCNSDGACDQDFESSEFCPEDCLCGDDICDDYEYGSESCAEDCEGINDEAFCGDGSCDNDETNDTCPEDCAAGSGDQDEKKGSGIIWYILLILILLGIFGFIIYKKKYGKKSDKGKGIFDSLNKGKAPVFTSVFGGKKEEKPAMQKGIGGIDLSKAKTDIEKELDKSLSEAKKLIEKEK